jgi:hypothetical protein
MGMKSRAKKSEFELFVSYPAKHYPDYDDKIKSALNKLASSSGMSFDSNPTRDMEFFYRTKEGAENGASKIRSLKLKNLTIRVTEIPK